MDTTESTSAAAAKSGHGLPSTGIEMELERCQVGSETNRPCFRPATVKIQSVPFCERCVREQEAYFAIGELTQELADDRTEQARDLLDEQLVETLFRLRWEFDERVAEAERRMEIVKQ